MSGTRNHAASIEHALHTHPPMPMMSFILKLRQARASMCEKSLITPNTDRWPYEGKREKRRLKEMSTTRVLHDVEWKLDDGASSRSSTKRNSCARDRSDTTLCRALIGYINAAGQRKTTTSNQRAGFLSCLSSAQRGWHESGSQTIFLCFLLIFLFKSEWNFFVYY